MNLSIGIVGLPNVGKSTLFQAITKKQVSRENYPFCTIEPNVGTVPVKDNRVDKLYNFSKSKKKIYATIKFVDIAGLVRGAHKGEGLGNQFLSHIKEVNAIVYVLRAFKNESIISTEGDIDVLRDKEILDTEMALKDLSLVEKRLGDLGKEARSGSKSAEKEIEALNRVKDFLNSGAMPDEKSFSDEERELMKQYNLLTLKPRIYILNGKQNEIQDSVLDAFKKNNSDFFVIDLLEQFEASELNQKEREGFGMPVDLQLDILIKKAYEILGLITFFTTGQDETRAWTIKKGARAPQAGGAIHSDFEKYFIRAEVINWQDLLSAGSYKNAKETGLVRIEGKSYVVSDGDVIVIRHGV